MRPLTDLMLLGRVGVLASLASFSVVIAFCAYLVATMAGAHGITRRRAFFAVIVTLLVWTALWGVANRAAPGVVRTLLV